MLWLRFPLVPRRVRDPELEFDVELHVQKCENNKPASLPMFADAQDRASL